MAIAEEPTAPETAERKRKRPPKDVGREKEAAKDREGDKLGSSVQERVAKGSSLSRIASGPMLTPYRGKMVEKLEMANLVEEPLVSSVETTLDSAPTPPSTDQAVRPTVFSPTVG